MSWFPTAVLSPRAIPIASALGLALAAGLLAHGASQLTPRPADQAFMVPVAFTDASGVRHVILPPTMGLPGLPDDRILRNRAEAAEAEQPAVASDPPSVPDQPAAAPVPPAPALIAPAP